MKRAVSVPLAAASAVLVVIIVSATRQDSRTAPAPAAQAPAVQGQLTPADLSLAAAVAKDQLGGNVEGARAQAVLSTYKQYLDQYASDVTLPGSEQGLYDTKVLVVSVTGDLSNVGFSHPQGVKVTTGRNMLIALERTTGRVLTRKIEATHAGASPAPPDAFDLSKLGGTPQAVPIT